MIYSNGNAPVAIAVEQKLIAQYANRIGFKSQLFNVKVGDKNYKVLPKQIQVHPVTDAPEHADFLSVTDESRVRVWVKVKFTNMDRAPGIKRGGTLNIIRRDLELFCTAANIPTTISIDLTGRQIGDSIHISEVALPEGATPTITDRDFTVAAIVGRQAEKEETEEAAAVEEGAEEADGEEGSEEGSEE